jgi:hypothetical protein
MQFIVEADLYVKNCKQIGHPKVLSVSGQIVDIKWLDSDGVEHLFRMKAPELEAILNVVHQETWKS